MRCSRPFQAHVQLWETFGLTLAQARAIIKEVATVTAIWRDTAKAAVGARSAEINRMASAFEHDDLKRALALLTRTFLHSFDPPAASPVAGPTKPDVASCSGLAKVRLTTTGNRVWDHAIREGFSIHPAPASPQSICDKAHFHIFNGQPTAPYVAVENRPRL